MTRLQQRHALHMVGHRGDTDRGAVWFETADGNGPGPGRVRLLPLDPDAWLDRARSLWMVLSMSVVQTLRSSELTSR